MQRASCRLPGSFRYTRSLHAGLSGDFEDPRKLGILRNTSCRPYREQLRSTRHANMLQGLLIVTGAVTVLVVMWFRSLEPTSAAEAGQLSTAIGALEALWLGLTGILGQEKAGAVAVESARAYYCSPRLDTRRLFRQIGRQVLNQEQALARLERAVKSERPFKSVALLGPPGVGKTLTVMALRQQFPWPENVHSYSWSTYVPDGAHKFHMMRNFLEQLSDCGQNLLIIDNLSPCDYSLVPIYNKLILEREGDQSAAKGNQTVLVVYIFNLDMQYYWEQFELLQQLPRDTTIISYRPFGREELSDCLENELRLEQRSLDQCARRHILEVAELDVQDSGCKRVRQLILQYGHSEPN